MNVLVGEDLELGENLERAALTGRHTPAAAAGAVWPR